MRWGNVDNTLAKCYFALVERRNTVLGAIVLILIVLGLIWYTRTRQPEQITDLPTPSPTQQLEDRFNTQIPEGAERTNLSPVNGEGSGLATRRVENGRLEHTVLAELPDPAVGEFYQGWLIRGQEGDENYDVVKTSRMRLAKAGFVLDYVVNQDLLDHNRVLISRERVDDSNVETAVLQGEF